MSTRILTTQYAPGGNTNAVQAVWTGLLNGDVGVPWEGVDWADRTVQVDGTFGTGGTIVLEGSNDGTNYVVLTDAQGNAVQKTSAALEVVEENPRYVRPRVSAGDGTTNLNCRLHMRRNR